MRRRDLRSAWRETPAWIACLALSLVGGIVTASWAGILDDPPGPAAALCVVLPLIVLRDAGLLLALRLRGGTLASYGWLLVFCISLHGFAPWVAAGFGADEARQFFSVDPSQGWYGVPVMICETLLVAAWLRLVWRGPRRAPAR